MKRAEKKGKKGDTPKLQSVQTLKQVELEELFDYDPKKEFTNYVYTFVTKKQKK